MECNIAQLMLPYEKLNEIGTVCSVKSYNKYLKCSLLALTQTNSRSATHLLPCR